ncbi:hypothetical protein J7438_25550 [Thalassotalea sp. G20_0]|uniref:hypothetical protein n=1 Tax=Thalassotalea sp. G20_0 TaxID=2821093 RepID=UPI001ADA3FFD|nr:hypothetical protein [Thalassotalea sp. G20_0]MBO9497423.1 hypothetical protein [Thalassotalea sp. G20_0]
MLAVPDGLNEPSVALANEPDPDEAKAVILDDTAWLLAISDGLNDVLIVLTDELDSAPIRTVVLANSA